MYAPIWDLYFTDHLSRKTIIHRFTKMIYSIAYHRYWSEFFSNRKTNGSAFGFLFCVENFHISTKNPRKMKSLSAHGIVRLKSLLEFRACDTSHVYGAAR